jgi:two-component system NtrC family sensor kinase
MTRCGGDLRRLGRDASSMEEVGSRVVNTLYRSLLSAPGGDRACALVRTFVTVPYMSLPPAQQVFAARMVPDIASRPTMKCLTLLATAGDEPAWNGRTTSVGHQALPLASSESIARSPMINQLMRQLGVEAGALLSSDAAMMIDDTQHSFNVFHVADALGSPHIPAQQEFVVPYGIRSVIGFGGLLPPGELFATILFARVPVSRDVAELFKTLALNVKVALLPFSGDRVFT